MVPVGKPCVTISNCQRVIRYLYDLYKKKYGIEVEMKSNKEYAQRQSTRKVYWFEIR